MRETDATRATFGTTEPPPECTEHRAGPVTAIFEACGLRNVRFHGVEAVRGIAFLARDASWATLPIEIRSREIDVGANATVLRFTAAAGPLACRGEITLSAAGRLDFSVEATSAADFVTNRTGFVVLHPAGLAGTPLVIGHSDGTSTEARFPALVAPTQPAFDICTLSHPLPGDGRCEIELFGDAYEMEDQRNWSDASFKTYIRPLAKPRPYLLPAGAVLSQRVALRLSGQPSPAAVVRGAPAAARLPDIALFVTPEELAASDTAAVRIGSASALILRLPPGEADAETVARAATLAERLGARLEVEVSAALREPDAEARAILRALPGCVAVIRVGPARDLVSHGPGAWPEGERPLAELVAALRRAGATAAIGAGTPSYFTEFNRNPPGPGADFIYFALAANVHAADDRSICETATVHPAIIETAAALCPGLPIRLGPVTIGMPHTPYGAAPAANPELRRIPASRLDPRQDGVFAAAFALAATVRASIAGVESLCLAAPTGDFGLLDRDGHPRPILHLHRELTRNGSALCHAAATGDHYQLTLPAAGVTYHANLAAEPLPLGQPVRLLTSAGWDAHAVDALPAYCIAHSCLPLAPTVENNEKIRR